MAETIRPQNYYDAAQAVLDVAAAVSKIHTDTMAALADTGAMAGTDDAGAEFADAYDTQAANFESMGRNLGPAIHQYGRVLIQMGKNHAQAEADSDVGGGAAVVAPADPGDGQLGMCVALATAAGGVGEGLAEVIGLLQHIGVPVPNGDTDKLDTASAAWAAVAAGSDGTYLGKLQGASSAFDELNGDEVDIVVEDLEELNSLVDEYALLAGALRDSVEAHKTYLVEVRNKIKDLLDELAIELAITAAAGILSAFVSFGTGAVVATAKATSTIARYGRKITELIGSLRSLRAGAKIGGYFKASSVAKSNERLVRYLRMELKTATTQGQKNNLAGRIGELKAGIDPAVPKRPIEINGRTRIPDEIDDTAAVVREVKNTNSIGASQQIKDMAQYASDRGYTMELIVDDRTVVSGPLQLMIDSGEIVLKRMALN
nr:putative toxin [Rhodococcus sp. (in: high G+C Gram-positive bacteria)]